MIVIVLGIIVVRIGRRGIFCFLFGMNIFFGFLKIVVGVIFEDGIFGFRYGYFYRGY